MRLRCINFGWVGNASGARNFFGEGYWFHPWMERFGLDYRFSTFTAKTATWCARAGNMPLKGDDMAPAEWKPKCIVVKWRKGVVLNAVGLSNPGIAALLAENKWQRMHAPFFISFAAVGASSSERLQGTTMAVAELERVQHEFDAPFGVQINMSCPNKGGHHTAMVEEVTIEEAKEMLSIFAQLGVPLVPKVNVVMPLDAVREIVSHEACDALCVTNTIPWGALPERINWYGLFGTDESPLKEYGGGGLSGKPLLPLLLEWLEKASWVMSSSMPIMAGGGILSRADVRAVMDAGAKYVELGSVSILRPWRVRSLIGETMKHIVTS